MVASMTRNLPSRGPHSHPARGVIFATALWRGVMATLVVTLSLVTGLSPAPVAAAPPARVAAWAPACPPAAPTPVIAETPWPQQRFDLARLSQITDGSPVTVAVVDSGVDANVPQLSATVRAGADLLHPGGDGRQDCVGHGTAVASIIAARARDGAGLRGLAPGVRILPIRVSENVEIDGVATGGGDVADLAAGIEAAVTADPRPGVINLSISTGRDDARLRAAIRAAVAADIVVVASAGNLAERGNPTPYPASYDGVIGVGGISRDGLRVPTSQIGSYVDLVAPGDDVVAASPGGGHRRLRGTSFATAFVSATAALIRARWPDLSRQQVIDRMLATADPTPGARPSPEYGYGVVNPVRALTEVAGPTDADQPALPAVATARAAPERRGPDRSAVTVAVGLVLLALAFAAASVAIPAGRRRRWRPDPVVTTLASPAEPAVATHDQGR